MHASRFDLLAALGQDPRTRMRRLLVRQRGFVAALGALMATLVLGSFGEPITPLTPATLLRAGLAGIAGVGLIAWHLARVTTIPRAQMAQAALPAALIPCLTMAGLGVPALLVPAVLTIATDWRQSRQRVVALMVQCGALVMVMAPQARGIAGDFVYVTMLGVATILAMRSLSGAANDNPSMERDGQYSKLPQFACYATPESIPGKWGVE